jgi:hypothetical protein
MKPLQPRPAPWTPWTHEDFMILTGQWEGRDWKRPPLLPHAHSVFYDRRDAELMLALAECRRDIGGSKAVAHRMLAGSTNRTEVMFINGFWVQLP